MQNAEKKKKTKLLEILLKIQRSHEVASPVSDM